MTYPRVAVVILNWNRKKDTLDCLESVSLADYPCFEIVVVDNGSSDGSVDAISERFPEITLLVNEENLGYAAGNNAGIRHAIAKGFGYICILNNDTIVAPDFLGLLLQVAEADPTVGIVGPMIYYFDRPSTIWSAGGLIDWTAGLPVLRGLNEEDTGQYTKITPVDYVAGCVMLVRSGLARHVGLLDPRFFMYFEEVDWCVRATRAGFKIVHVPAAKVWHKISIRAQAASPTVAYYMARNHLLFLRNAETGLSTRARVLAGYVRTLASYTFRPKHRAHRGKRNAVAKGVADFCRGNWGKVKP